MYPSPSVCRTTGTLPHSSRPSTSLVFYSFFVCFHPSLANSLHLPNDVPGYLIAQNPTSSISLGVEHKFGAGLHGSNFCPYSLILPCETTVLCFDAVAQATENAGTITRSRDVNQLFPPRGWQEPLFFSPGLSSGLRNLDLNSTLSRGAVRSPYSGS